MNDDQNDVKFEAGEEASLETPSVEEPKATEEVETQTEEPEATVKGESGETQTETVEAPKKGAQQRIRELASEKNRERDRANSLEQKLAELTSPVGGAPQAPYTPQVRPGQDVTPEQYRSDVVGTAASVAHLINKQGEAVNRINTEAHEVVRKYPQLDPDSDQFDKELSEAVTEATEAYVTKNPYTASPRQFVDKLMKPYQRSVIKEVGQEAANIAKQVAESATRPTSVTTKGGKTFEDMSIPELEKTLGVHHS